MSSDFDYCKYSGCSNGTHNNFKLFNFPSVREKQLTWIENSG